MAPTVKECDYLVIGGGSGGIASARRASSYYGAKTIVIESSRLGGTCVNVGCVPKKITYNAAMIKEMMHDSKPYGFHFKEEAPFEWSSFKTKRDNYVKRLNGIYEKNLESAKVEYLHGRATLLDKQTAEVKLDDGTKTTIKTKHLLIAVGGHPSPNPKIPGGELGLNSDGFFEISKQPKRVAIVGAGYIAVEFAGMFNALGTETHLFIRHETFLRTFDPMIQEKSVKEYERLGVKLHKNSTQTKVEKVEGKDGWMKLSYKDKEHPDGADVEIDALIFAIGRQPEVEDLGLDNVGIKQSEKGHIVVDDYQNTNVDGVYALGDVCGKAELTPVAIAAGRKLAARLFGGPEFKDSKLNYDNIPSVVFAHPEIGSIGLTEPEARKKFGDKDIKVYTTNFPAMFYAMVDNPDDKPPTSYKIVCQGPEEKVVGLHIIGLGSGEILQGFGVAINMGATKKDFDRCVAIHPVSAEELVTMT